jgi:peptidoglycan/xylan/chitin deacetylase (PgdA/CDA1 family)
MGAGVAVRRAARTVFHRAGGLRVVRWLNRKGVRILMYHRFADAASLDSQCRHIRENYSPVSMDQVDRWLRSGDPLRPNSVAVTVDDGYRDFGAVAYPVFEAWQIPVTVYLVSDFLDGTLWLWVDQVKFAFLHSRLPHFRMALPGGTALEFALGSPEERRRAARDTCEALKLQPNECRLAALAELWRTLEVGVPTAPPPEDAPLDWGEVRRMSRGMATFGAHTRSHPILSRLSAEGELAGEITGSKLRIEEALGRPVDHFCYPNGGPGDITPECVEIVRRAQFRTAVTTRTGLNFRADDAFQLRRIGVEPGLEPPYFQQCAAAFRV